MPACLPASPQGYPPCEPPLSPSLRSELSVGSSSVSGSPTPLHSQHWGGSRPRSPDAPYGYYGGGGAYGSSCDGDEGGRKSSSKLKLLGQKVGAQPSLHACGGEALSGFE